MRLPRRTPGLLAAAAALALLTGCADDPKQPVAAPSPGTPSSGLRLTGMMKLEKRYFLPAVTGISASLAQAGRSGRQTAACSSTMIDWVRQVRADHGGVSDHPPRRCPP